jgi:hypothetical protein
MSARPATPPITPPTMLPIFASPLLGIVSPPPGSESAGSGPMTPAAASPGDEGAGVGDCGFAANGVFKEVASEGVSIWLGCFGSATADDGRTADASAPGDVNKGAGAEDRLGDGGRAAVGIVSELVGVGSVETSGVTTATCEATAATAGMLFSTGLFGPAAACSDGARIASGIVGASGIETALIVPIAEETAAACVVVGAAKRWSAAAEEGGGAAAEDDGGGGGGGEAREEAAPTTVVCACCACSAVVEVVTSVGVTTAGSAVVVVRIEVAAVRARERVHRRPLTVVIDSCGEAMQATGSKKETPAAFKVGDGGREIQAPWALSAY